MSALHLVHTAQRSKRLQQCKEQEWQLANPEARMAPTATGLSGQACTNNALHNDNHPSTAPLRGAMEPMIGHCARILGHISLSFSPPKAESTQHKIQSHGNHMHDD